MQRGRGQKWQSSGSSGSSVWFDALTGSGTLSAESIT